MSIYIKDGVLHVSGAQEKLRAKGKEIPEFLDDYTLLDIETTGLRPYRDRITELGAIKVRDGEIVDQYSNLTVYPKSNHVPEFITQLNGITEEKLLKEGIPIENAIQEFRDFIGDDVVIGYNVNFDLNFIYDQVEKQKLPRLSNDYVDVMRFANIYYPKERHNRLIDCMQRAKIAEVEQHRGLDDSIDTKKVYDDFKEHFTSDLLKKMRAQIKNVDLVNDTLTPAQLGMRNPIRNKNIVFSGHLHLNVDEARKMVENMRGHNQEKVSATTNCLVMGDHDFFRRDNENLNTARQLIKEGKRIKRLSESFFLEMLDSWARN